jgi:hypothetical protein
MMIRLAFVIVLLLIATIGLRYIDWYGKGCEAALNPYFTGVPEIGQVALHDLQRKLKIETPYFSRIPELGRHGYDLHTLL